MSEELKEIHEEATEPQSDNDTAQSLDLTQDIKKIAEDNTRAVIVEVLKIHGVDFESLNISKSKFNKLNKLQLLEAMRDFKPHSEKEMSETADNAKNGLLVNGLKF